MVQGIGSTPHGRSTNCLIDDLGIYIHKKERGYLNYALTYSWDVRLGHKTREGALDELNDTIDARHVEKTLSEIGYDEARYHSGVDQTALEAFYVGSEDLTDQELRRQLDERLPPQLIPAHLQRVDSIPLTASGKVDEKALSHEAVGRRPQKPYRDAEGPVEEYLVGIWHFISGGTRCALTAEGPGSSVPGIPNRLGEVLPGIELPGRFVRSKKAV